MVKVNGTSGKVVFQIKDESATSVCLMGTFNDWNDARHPMKKGKDGVWKTEISLPAGEHQFLYLVDRRTWRSDESAQKVVNTFGTENSLIKVPEKSKTKKSAQKSSKSAKK